jgi:hypothetical protein
MPGLLTFSKKAVVYSLQVGRRAYAFDVEDRGTGKCCLIILTYTVSDTISVLLPLTCTLITPMIAILTPIRGSLRFLVYQGLPADYHGHKLLLFRVLVAEDHRRLDCKKCARPILRFARRL